tara:strand:- start:316 stop:465 length:150 start_codon:yes stop_codon:yes gene_type:complete
MKLHVIVAAEAVLPIKKIKQIPIPIDDIFKILGVYYLNIHFPLPERLLF